MPVIVPMIGFAGKDVVAAGVLTVALGRAAILAAAIFGLIPAALTTVVAGTPGTLGLGVPRTGVGITTGGGVVVTVTSTGTVNSSTTPVAGEELISKSSAAVVTLNPTPFVLSFTAIVESRIDTS